MKRYIYGIIWTSILITILMLPANAQEYDHSDHDHGSMQEKAGQQNEMGDHSGHNGKLVQESTVNGHALAYHLIDMRQAMAEMEGHSGHAEQSATHHLMVYITGPKGDPVTDAKVGFLIEGPNNADQKVMAMGMGSGYGADIYLGDKGAYTIKAKAVAGDTTLIDGFDYKVE